MAHAKKSTKRSVRSTPSGASNPSGTSNPSGASNPSGTPDTLPPPALGLAASVPLDGDDAGYSLTPARRAEQLSATALALGEDIVAFPGRSRDRVRWLHRVRIVALRDAAELVRAPFHAEPALTLDEIHAQRDHIELFRAVESELQDQRAGKAVASRDFSTLAAEATGHKELLLRAFDLRFRDDPAGQRRVSQIRAGSGDTDLVQDVSDIALLCAQNMPYLEGCPRGEAAAARRLTALSPRLSHLLGAKTLSDEARAARQLRDAAFSLATRTDQRVRAAAAYWYGGTEKMKDYAAYSPPTGSSAETDAQDEGAGEAAPVEPGAAPGAAAPRPATPTPGSPTHT